MNYFQKTFFKSPVFPRSFYLMVAAYSSYTNMRLRLFGSNVNSVTPAPTTTPGPTTTPSGGGGNATG